MPVVAQKTAVVAQKAKPAKPEPVKTPKATGEKPQVKPAKTPPRQATPASQAKANGKRVKRLPPQPPTRKAAPTPQPPTEAIGGQRPRLSETAEVNWKLEEKWPWEPGKPMPKDKKGQVLSFELVQHMGSTFYEFVPQSKTKFKVLKKDGYQLVDAKLFDHEQARQAWRQLRKAKYLIVGDECCIDVV
jgi:hypothetical protein